MTGRLMVQYMGTLPVPVETVFSEEALRACSTAPDTPTSGNIKPAGIYSWKCMQILIMVVGCVF